MNKTELIGKIHEQEACSDLKKRDIEATINALIEVVQDTLKSGDKVTLTGFGTFEVRDRAARKGRNPKTGEVLDIPASKAPAFKAGKAFKDIFK